MEPFVTALEDAINGIAVEPISINVKKELTIMEWNFTKPAKMLPRSRLEPRAPTPAPTPMSPASDDPLKALQMRFVNGEIIKERYKEMKQFLEGS